MMRVVIDCNIWIICLTSKSPYHQIYKDFIEGKFDICVTNEILFEYEEIIQLKYGTATATSFLSLLRELPNVIFIEPWYQWNLIKADNDDNKYVDCAIAGQTDNIVTQDNHFSILKTITFPKVSYCLIDEFMEMINKENIE
ncbi:MAG: putative toxin-antitoxin system toxin component, PIN family [Arachidicoccus sp.]|nr:putative toxin-antitoxin system toxin component, PIN family [Arachidicoccus sp.]